MRCRRIFVSRGILLAAIAVSVLWDTACGQIPDTADTREIQALGASFAKAFNEGDANKIAASFIKEGSVTDYDGVTTTGRDAIQSRYAATFRDSPGIQLALETRSVTVLSPNVAIEEGVAAIRHEDPNGVEEVVVAKAPYNAVFVKQDGRWMHAMIRDYLEPEDVPSPHERLSKLVWMVGDWVEEGAEMTAKSTCSWDENGNFLIWRYQIQQTGANASGGTTFMGWDPRTAQIRSWLFDADGGHGEATWTQIKDDEWLVKASGVLADGRTASATQYVRKLGPDRISWTSFDREVGGEAVADVSEYFLVRIPPKPGTGKNGR